MTGRGRPLRFLVVVLGGWVGFRAVMLWPATLPASATRLMVLHPVESTPASLAPVDKGPIVTAAIPAAFTSPVYPSQLPAPKPVVAGLFVAEPSIPGLLIPGHARRAVAVQLALQGMARFGATMVLPPVDVARFAAPGMLASRDQPRSPGGSRWRASLWLFARGGDTAQAGFAGGTLGGSQAGARVGYLVDRAERLMIYGRVSTALAQPQAEAALGADWRPTPLPVHLIAEQRVGLNDARGGPTLGIIAGAGPVTVAHSFRLEAYGQAGAVLRDGGVGFADGGARLDHGVAQTGRFRLSLGGGIWGAAQPDAQRLDLGPSLTIDVPVRAQPLRLSFDWRERVAGAARPASGPALTLGTNF